MTVRFRLHKMRVAELFASEEGLYSEELFC